MSAESASGQGRKAGFATFDVFRVEGKRTAAALIETVTSGYSQYARHAPGFLSARVHVNAKHTAVAVRGEWTGKSAYRSFWEAPRVDVLHALGSQPDVHAETAFEGGPAAVPLKGPEEGARPGVVVVATRYLAGPQGAEGVLKLFRHSGEWKESFPGFISATPYLNADATTFINYPMWVDEDAYRAWMADPRISEGQEELARLDEASLTRRSWPPSPPCYWPASLPRSAASRPPARAGRPAGAGWNVPLATVALGAGVVDQA